jgi:hypothetical protein
MMSGVLIKSYFHCVRIVKVTVTLFQRDFTFLFEATENYLKEAQLYEVM